MLERRVHLFEHVVEQIAHAPVAGEETLSRSRLAGDAQLLLAPRRQPAIEQPRHLGEMQRPALHRQQQQGDEDGPDLERSRPARRVVKLGLETPRRSAGPDHRRRERDGLVFDDGPRARQLEAHQGPSPASRWRSPALERGEPSTWPV